MKITITRDGNVFKDNILLKPRLIRGYLKSKPKFGNYKFKAIYQDIMNDYQEGMLVRDICNKYSIGHTTLNNYLRRLNIVRHR